MRQFKENYEVAHSTGGRLGTYGVIEFPVCVTLVPKMVKVFRRPMTYRRWRKRRRQK